MKKHEFQGWTKVKEILERDFSLSLNKGQKRSLSALAERLPDNGVIIADEVGMGKTRIAAATAKAVVEAGGRVAILVPPGLGYQWNDELNVFGLQAPPLLRSLWQYFEAWSEGANNGVWMGSPVLVISHAFTNWRLGESSAAWRWSLLPHLYAHLRKNLEISNKFPRNYQDGEALRDIWVENAAKFIAKVVAFECSDFDPHSSLIMKADELYKKIPWPDAMYAAEYGRNADLRPWLECAVGLGLGAFDLVIIDEAHKSRRHESGLNRLLENVIIPTDDFRRLAMSATPIELDAGQWIQILGRIGVNTDDAADSKFNGAVVGYIERVNAIQSIPGDPAALKEFKRAARSFQDELSPYLLRRDKREDEAVELFRKRTKSHYHAYRKEEEIRVDTGKLPENWKKAICAVEALSFVAGQSNDEISKRARLGLGSGHSIATLLDRGRGEEDGSDSASASGAVTERTTASDGVEASKKQARVDWWAKQLKAALVQNEGEERQALFSHPALLAAVEEIEKVCEKEKILVFGRFNRPMQALVDLLNAREMLRRLKSEGFWPQRTVDHWDAVEAAHRQLGISGELSRENVESELKKRYVELEKSRHAFRDGMLKRLELEFDDLRGDAIFPIFEEFRKNIQNNDQDVLVLMARALYELVDTSKPGSYAQAFIDLMTALGNQDPAEEDDVEDAEEQASMRWEVIKAHLREEYSSPQGGYARLMNGNTRPSTRRVLQLAFNHPNAHPKVLVAQSVVGREGLNLHKACRTVLLLHPEWNPGVVEQQIGRVDRLGSLWERKLREQVANQKATGQAPEEGWSRIRVLSIVFSGTYDEHNWQVLHERWDDLRAQLHGVLIPPHEAQRRGLDPETVQKINAAAPNFSPGPRRDAAAACN